MHSKSCAAEPAALHRWCQYSLIVLSAQASGDRFEFFLFRLYVHLVDRLKLSGRQLPPLTGRQLNSPVQVLHRPIRWQRPKITSVKNLGIPLRRHKYTKINRISVVFLWPLPYATRKKFVRDGQNIPGREVSTSTRQKHTDAVELAQMAADAGLFDPPRVVPQPQVQPQLPVPSVEIFQQALEPVFTLCILLAGWLNLHVGISRVNSGIFLKALRLIIATTISLIFGVWRTAGFNTESPTVQIPQDIRTVYQHGLDPEIKVSRKSVTGENHLDPTPVVLLCGRRPHIEEQLEKTFQQDQARQNLPQPKIMTDVQDSPAWRNLGNFVLTRYHLVFAYYIDWFNPFTNKIAGATVSCGAIIMYCLNLPIDTRFLLENVFVLGLIPIGLPDVWTTSHILLAFAQMMREFAAPGKILPTHRNPLGVPVAARMLTIIADLQAIRKVTGYMAVNATLFCNWCLLKLNEIESLDYRSWELRSSQTVAAQARAWFNATTLKLKTELSKASGVRWSPIHDIPKWDPVLHIILGWMHNWLEGILMRHLRVYWGIGRPKKVEKDVQNLGDLDDMEEHLSGSEMSASDSELEDLQQEQAHSDKMDEGSDRSTTPTQETFMGFGADQHEDEDDDDDDYLDFDVPGMFNFSSTELGAIRSCIKRIALPTWVARPPTNLGEAKHGKLKAYEYLILFTVIFPLIIPELWWNKGNVEMALLQNFHNLIGCTKIVSSFSTTNVDAERFTGLFVKYREILPRLFPVNFHSVANQHLAMHYEKLLKFWGPMPALSEFFGERINGVLQQVKTNGQEDDMPLTMLRQLARRCRLEAKIHDEQSAEGPAGDLARILQPVTAASTKATQPLSELEVAKILSVAEDLDQDDYQLLLHYQNSQGQLWRDCYQLPHPDGSLVLPPCALKPNEFKIGDQTFSRSRSTRGSSAIQFKDPQSDEVLTGFIDEIWEIPLESHIQTFIMVEKHKLLSPAVLETTPFPSFPNFQTTAVHAARSNNYCIIEPRHILTHLTVFKRPKGTFGIRHKILVICWALNRGRRS
ncbi:hypothetical protein C8R47DRAFT_1204264 [Mycena vitilis]|nr:hypothetical protein C8R47DRAFT_1204264 [Mycena vitilis]